MISIHNSILQIYKSTNTNAKRCVLIIKQAISYHFVELFPIISCNRSFHWWAMAPTLMIGAGGSGVLEWIGGGLGGGMSKMASEGPFS